MSEFESYFLLFVDSFVSNFVIGFTNELVIHTMKKFGSYNSGVILLVAVSSALLASSANYLLGRVLLNMFYFGEETKKHLKEKPLIKFFLEYQIILLTLMIIPFWGNLFSLFAGFIKIKFLRMLAIGAFVKICYYGYILYI